MNRLNMSTLLFLALVLMLSTTGVATPITFQYSTTLGVDIFQQTSNSPCVIGNPSCAEPSGMFYDNIHGPAGASYDLFSTVYLASGSNNFGLNQIPLTFFIGVDDNFNVNHEFLVAFNTYDCGTVGPVSSADSDTQTSLPAGCLTGTKSAANSWNSIDAPTYALMDMSQSDNGNGYSNFILKGFSLTAGHYYVFEAVVNPSTDGIEQFFIIPTGAPPAVPEPVTLSLVGTGLLSLFFFKRKANRR